MDLPKLADGQPFELGQVIYTVRLEPYSLFERMLLDEKFFISEDNGLKLKIEEVVTKNAKIKFEDGKWSIANIRIGNTNPSIPYTELTQFYSSPDAIINSVIGGYKKHLEEIKQKTQKSIAYLESLKTT